MNPLEEEIIRFIDLDNNHQLEVSVKSIVGNSFQWLPVYWKRSADGLTPLIM